MITFNDFKKMDMRIAQIKEVKEHPDADKLLVLKIDVGQEEKQIVAGIKNFYRAQELVGKKAVVIVNLEPATIRGVESQAMLLASRDDNALSLLIPDRDVKVGSKIS